MFINNKIKFLFLILFSASIIGFTGCEKKTETPENQKEVSSDNNLQKSDSTNTPEENKIPDLTGTWTGKFDKRAATMKITDQNENEFKGKISIAYRQAINQDISGSIDTAKNTVAMKDLLHSRFMGKYSGKLSEDEKSISGTFTMNLDGKKFSFNFKRK